MAEVLQMTCRICVRRFAETEMVQIWPCLHMFCGKCIDIHRKFSKLCPAADCCCLIKVSDDLKWNMCDNQICSRRLSPPIDLFKMSVCQHEICVQCYNDASRKEPQLCPVDKCGQALIEEDDGECDGQCHKQHEADKLVVTQCCQAKYCHPCYQKLIGDENAKIDPKTCKCPPGKCVDKEQKKKPARHKSNVPTALTKCMGYAECNGEALRNFPSEQECDHEVCLNCLDKAIAQCALTDSLPMCPNNQCRLPYRYESVAALKALLPHHAKYFANLALDSTLGYEVIRDDSVTSIDIRLLKPAKLRSFEMKCSVSEEDEQGPSLLTFTKDGTLGELLREVRRTLKILPTDKVYGYFVRRDEADDEQLIVNNQTSRRLVSDYNFDVETHLIVDVTGIVMTKKQKAESAAKHRGKG
ncbi:unnamed protein product [Bursaphelenchus okinawaensis]|uniref:RING-type domain-containing protein n=1 Tax=Bursaphelenchus okinawaensis TaxID=465554 RepID=A0A811JSG5_9BILA|nr:unnamed protein product [Bursaphelenchus okinawaensis]CAG9080495.1 unnamed protein product [Bursaphelenchus okinawaensis]